jgi:hypothetical protein
MAGTVTKVSVAVTVSGRPTVSAPMESTVWSEMYPYIAEG